MSYSALKSAVKSDTPIVNDPVMLPQYRSPSSSSTVCTVTLPLQGRRYVMLCRNAGTAAMLNGTHSSIDEK